MRGYPKILSSKEDYYYIIENFDESLWKVELQNLLDTMKDWFFEKNLKDKSDGIVDETHKIEESGEEDNIQYMQYVLRENPDCKLFRLGFTVEEVKNLLQK